MNYIDIDTFGGIVTNADSEDLRTEIGQDLINFTIDKAGTLKFNEKYIIRKDFDNKLLNGVFFWTDFTFNDQKFIIIIDKETNFVQLLNNNYSLFAYKYFDNVDGSTSNFNLGIMSQPFNPYKSTHSFLSTGGEVRIAASNNSEPKLLQYINDRKFWGHWNSDDDWFVQKKLVAPNTEVYVDADDGFFLDIAYPRNDYARGRFMLSESSSDLDLNFTINPTCRSTKAEEFHLLRTFSVASAELVGNHTYDSATVNTSYVTHEYAVALVYDGHQIGPLTNSSYTRLKTVKPHTRFRARGMSARIDLTMNLATMQGSSTANVREHMQNPRVTGIALYRAISPSNYTKVKAKSAMRRVGTYRIDRSESDMNRESISSSNIQMLDFQKILTIDSARFASSIGGGITSTHFKYYWDSTGDSEPEEISLAVAGYDDTYGVYSFNNVTSSNFVPDLLSEWALTQNSAAIGNGAGIIYNSGIKAVGGENWIIVPGTVKQGDGHYKNCAITEQSNTATTKFDIIVESYFGEHKKANGDVVYYHACRLAGGSLFKEFKENGLTNVYIYRTNEPIYWFHRHDNQDDSTNKTRSARIFIYDTDPVAFEGHPYPNDKVNHGYEVQHTFMGRRFVGNVTINLGDDDEELHKNMMLFSEVGMYDVIPSANFIQLQNEFGGEVTGFSDMGADLVVFTTNTINMLNMRGPDPSSWTMSTVSNQVGCIATDSIVKIKDRIFFAGNDSCYYIASTGQLVPISEPINDTYRALSDAAKQKTVTVYDAEKGILYWQFGSSDTVNGSLFVFELHLTRGDVSWTKRTFNRPISIMTQDFNQKPAFISVTERIDNPLAR